LQIQVIQGGISLIGNEGLWRNYHPVLPPGPNAVPGLAHGPVSVISRLLNARQLEKVLVTALEVFLLKTLDLGFTQLKSLCPRSPVHLCARHSVLVQESGHPNGDLKRGRLSGR
jgi:hypothetical protein